MEAIKDFFGSLLLTELLKGMALTGRYMFPPLGSGDARRAICPTTSR